jgi:hypothetical protein
MAKKKKVELKQEIKPEVKKPDKKPDKLNIFGTKILKEYVKPDNYKSRIKREKKVIVRQSVCLMGK